LADLRRYALIDEAPETVAGRIAMAADLGEALAGAELVQENVAERVEVKAKLFEELDALVPRDVILASSTSSLPASSFTEKMPGRARCLVAHPVNPPYLIPLVELVPAPWTDPDIVARAREFYAAVGQSPIVVKREVGGFVLNRLQGALLNEAFRLVEDEVVSAADLDRTLADGLGLRWSFMGPFETIDLNAPGGIRDYCERYGAMYHEMAQTRAGPRPWGRELVLELERERRAILPGERLSDRQAWRDRMLMRLLAHKRRAAAEEN
jgi:3-hydroxyacyl-CoA dehydrogenase